ncbi:MAG: hypothetical protein NC124_02560 [Clostridium sp.]|nr:hypothetical protein [Clostridium sp.]
MSYLEELLPEFRKGAKIRKSFWLKNDYIVIDEECLSAKNKKGEDYIFHTSDLLEDEWELYQEPIDWGYVIKNKCLCWFWDSDRKDESSMGVLCEFSLIGKPFFRMLRGEFYVDFENCRPVRRDEVTFYEDREDETLFRTNVWGV